MTINTKHKNIVHKVWTEMETIWKYNMCVPYVDNFINGNGKYL